MRTLAQLLTLVFAVAVTTLAVRGQTVVMTFESAPGGGGFWRGMTFDENGIRITSGTDNAWFGQFFGGDPSMRLEFYGENQYVEFSLVDGSTFNLQSFDLTIIEVVGGSRWIETSQSPGTLTALDFPNPSRSELFQFSGPAYSDLTWFRVGTPFLATDIDNVTMAAPVPEPSTYALILALLVVPPALSRRWLVNRHFMRVGG